MASFLNRGSVFSIEATVSILIFGVIISLIPHYDINLNRAVLYKQGSDISLVILEKEMLGDRDAITELLERTNKDLNLKIIYEGREVVIKWNEPKTVISIDRPMFSNGRMIEVRFMFGI